MPRGADGRIYEYVDADFGPDVYVYRREGSANPRAEARDFLKELRVMRFDGDISAYDIQLDDAATVTVGERDLNGHEIVFNTVRRGLRRDGYFLVLVLPEHYIKFRITQNQAYESLPRAREFVKAWLADYFAER